MVSEVCAASGIDLAKLPRRCLQKGILLKTNGGRVVRVAPPLTIEKATLDDIEDILEEIVGELAQGEATKP